ncbi:hypothetical protein VR44_11810 [Streptomyces katrae]|uniref:Uncharacterized protein n=1 Tax=Streptomyces katrae TaxID=68223 RepID=A0A0F4JJU0_9ACTN|nr:hypothetical protein VR44_11810 [Streptomyces katrae]
MFFAFVIFVVFVAFVAFVVFVVFVVFLAGLAHLLLAADAGLLALVFHAVHGGGSSGRGRGVRW